MLIKYTIDIFSKIDISFLLSNNSGNRFSLHHLFCTGRPDKNDIIYSISR
jgi:hypothetical protein